MSNNPYAEFGGVPIQDDPTTAVAPTPQANPYAEFGGTPISAESVASTSNPYAEFGGVPIGQQGEPAPTDPTQPGWSFAKKVKGTWNSDENVLHKAWDIANTPLVDKSDVGEGNRSGIVGGVEDFAAGFTSPLNAALTVATMGAGPLLERMGISAATMEASQLIKAAKTAGKLATAGFGALQLKGIAEESPSFVQAVKNGDTQKALEIGTSMLLQGATAGLAAKHLANETGMFSDPNEPVTSKDLLVGRYTEALKKDTDVATRFNQDLKKAVPNQVEREAIHFYGEAGGNTDTLAAWEKQVTESKDIAPDLQRQVVRDLQKAQSLSPKAIEKVSSLRDLYESVHHKATAVDANGQPTDTHIMEGGSYRDNYFARAPWEHEPDEFENVNNAKEQLGDGSQDHTQRRVFESTIEGVLKGYKPRKVGGRYILDSADLASDYYRTMGREMAKSQFVSRAKAMYGDDGRPLAVPGGVISKFDSATRDKEGNLQPNGDQITMLNSDGLGSHALTKVELAKIVRAGNLQDMIDSGKIIDRGPRPAEVAPTTSGPATAAPKTEGTAQSAAVPENENLTAVQDVLRKAGHEDMVNAFAEDAADQGWTPEEHIKHLEEFAQEHGVGEANPPQGPLANKEQEGTKEFHDWFDGSKVVDEQGRPKVLYHGTSSDWHVFDPAAINEASHGLHTGTLDQASDFVKQVKPGAHIKPVYVSMKNPLRMKDYGSWRPEDMAKRLASQGVTDVRDGGRSNVTGLNTFVDKALEDAGFEKGKTPHDWAKYDEVKNTASKEYISQLLEKHGYDGIVYQNHFEGMEPIYNSVKPKNYEVVADPETGKPAIYREGEELVPPEKIPSYTLWPNGADGAYEIRSSDGELYHTAYSQIEAKEALESANANSAANLATKLQEEELGKDRQNLPNNSGDSYIALRGHQVKSSIGNNGEFGHNDDILANKDRVLASAKSVGDDGSVHDVGELRVNGRGEHTAWLSPDAMNILKKAMGGTEDQRLNGLNLGDAQAKRMIARLDRMAKDPDTVNADLVEKVRDLLQKGKDATSVDGINSVANAGKNMRYTIDTLREERTHTAQNALSDDGTISTHLSPQRIKSTYSAIPMEAHAYLDSKGYDTNKVTRVIETSAKLISGCRREMGVSDEDALAFLKKYKQAVEEQHGADAFQVFKHAVGVAKQLRDEDLNGKTREQGLPNGSATEGNVGGPGLGGRQEGAGNLAQERGGKGSEPTANKEVAKDDANYPGRYRFKTDDYTTVKSRRSRATVYGGKDGSLLQAHYAFHPDVAKQAKLILNPEKSWLQKNPVTKTIMGLSTQAKQSLLSLSGFHWVQIGLRGVESGINPLKPLLEMKDGVKGWDLDNPSNPDQQRQLKLVEANGIAPGIDHGAHSFAEGLQGHGPISKIPGIGPVVDSVNNALFGPNGYIDRMKLNAALDFERRLRPTIPDEMARYKAAGQLANQRFGGLNYLAMGRSQEMRDILRMTLLAPDWLESNMRDAVSTLGPYGKLSRFDFARIAMYNFAAAQTLNLLTTGKIHPEQPFGVVSKDGQKVYSVRTLPADIFHALTQPMDYATNRLNPLVSRTGVELLTGRDRQGHIRDMGQQIQDLLENITPIPLHGVTNALTGNFHPGESGGDYVRSAMGLTTKPNNTPAQELAYKLSSQNSSSGRVPSEEAAHFRRVMEYEDRLRGGDTSASDDLQRDLQAGKVTLGDYRQVMKGATTSRLQAVLNRLPMSDAVDVWNLATNDEREELSPIMAKKMVSFRKTEAQKLTPNERAHMDAKMASVLDTMFTHAGIQ